jgi:hypothetical protein
MVRGKGKMTKVRRGTGRHFSKEEDMNGRNPRRENEDSDSDEDGDSEEEEEEEEEEESDKGGGTKEEEESPGVSRTQKREENRQKKKPAEKSAEDGDEDPDLINPNHVQKKMNISDLNTPRELTRREREQKEKQEAKDRYWKLHVQGKTDEAKADLGRLAKVRAEREAALAKRKAEAEAKAAEAEAKKKAQLAKRAT